MTLKGFILDMASLICVLDNGKLIFHLVTMLLYYAITGDKLKSMNGLNKVNFSAIILKKYKRKQ